MSKPSWGTIGNGANTPLNLRQGTVPDMSGALTDYFQQMTFDLITKTTVEFQVVEVSQPINFWGVIQSIERKLNLDPQGQRAWSRYRLHADTTCKLKVDDVVRWNNIQMRVMLTKDFSAYGYYEYELIQDFTGSGPSP